MATFFFPSVYFQYPVLGVGRQTIVGEWKPRALEILENGAEPVDCVGNGNLPFAGHRVPQRLTQQKGP